MDDLHTFTAKLLDLDPDQVQPGWELAGLMYRLIQLQHRAIGFTLDRLQMHGPSGHTFAAMHSVTLQLNVLRAAYAAVSTADQQAADDAKRQLDELTPDPDQFTPNQWFHEAKLEAARLAGSAPTDLHGL